MDLFGDPRARDAVSPFVEQLWQRGATHERRVIEKIGEPFRSFRLRASREGLLTREAMSRGASFIYSERISSNGLVGEPDLLRKSGSGYLSSDIKSGMAEEGTPNRMATNLKDSKSH